MVRLDREHSTAEVDVECLHPQFDGQTLLLDRGVRYQLCKSGVYGRACIATVYVVKFSLDIIVIGKCKAVGRRSM